jgi:hypothetical protein
MRIVLFFDRIFLQMEIRLFALFFDNVLVVESGDAI